MSNVNSYIWFSGESELSRFKSCFDENNSPKTLEHLRWQYKNTFHKVPALVALGLSDSLDIQSKLSGIYATFPVEFYLNGDLVSGIQSLDTLTSSEFRGRGLFNDLANAVYEKSISKGVELIYGFPNGNSAHGFFKKLNWVSLDPVPFLVKPISINYVFSKIPGLKIISKLFSGMKIPCKKANFSLLKENVIIDAAYDNLWIEFRKKITIGVNRSASFMKWRLEDKPGYLYDNIAAYDGSGNMIAIGFYSLQRKHGGNIGYIMDLIFLPNNESTAINILMAINNKLAERGCDAVLAWCFEHSIGYRIFKKCGYLNFPEKFRPIELHFGARSFSEKNKEIINKRKSWYLSYIDSDTV